MEDGSSVSPMTTEQIRQSANKWTLAGDVGLLSHLQNFSQDIIRRADATESLLSNLSNEVEATSTNLSNVSNQFLSLQNSQFIENRVYEDDSPLDDAKPKLKETEEVESQQVTMARYKEAVSAGLALLDSHFDHVEILESSDEEEASESNPTLVYRPKAVYTKPLPLLIGSTEWWRDDNVGLGEYQENDDSDDRLMSASESDAEAPSKEHAAQKRVRLSSSSSTSSSEVQKKRPPLAAEMSVKQPNPANLLDSPADDLFEDSSGLLKPNTDIFDSEGTDLFRSTEKPTVAVTDQNVASSRIEEAPDNSGEGNIDDGQGALKPKQVIPKVPIDFARELAAKLGAAVKTPKSLDSDDIESKKPAPQGEVKSVEPSVRRKAAGLFDDDDDDPLFQSSSKSPELFVSNRTTNTNAATVKNPTSHSKEPVAASSVKADRKVDVGASSRSLTKSSVNFYDDGPPPIKSSIFDDDSEGDDDLFGGKHSKPTHGLSKGLFAAVDLFSDDNVDDDLFSPKKLPDDKNELAVPNLREETATSTPPVRVPSVQFVTPNEPGSGGPSMKSSTPAVDNSPQLSMSCPISDLQDTPSLSDIQEESCDRGFIEDSSISSESGGNTSNLEKNSRWGKLSPATWFQPGMSSTNKANESTGYNTGGFSSNTPGASLMPSTIQGENEEDLFSRKSNSSVGVSVPSSSKLNTTADSEDIFPVPSLSTLPPKPELRNSKSLKPTSENTEPSPVSSGNTGPLSKSENSAAAISQMGRSLAPHLPLVADDSDEDLFSSEAKHSKSESVNNAVGSLDSSSNLKQHDELFPTKSFQADKNKNKGQPAHSSKPVSIFSDCDDDDDLFSGMTVKKEDTVSVSSSRSSIFDEGKSNLPGLFGKDVPPKVVGKFTSLFEDVDDDCDLFSQPTKKKGEDIRTVSKDKTDNSKLVIEPLPIEDRLSPKVFPVKLKVSPPLIVPRQQQKSLLSESPVQNSLFSSTKPTAAAPKQPSTSERTTFLAKENHPVSSISQRVEIKENVNSKPNRNELFADASQDVLFSSAKMQNNPTAVPSGRKFQQFVFPELSKEDSLFSNENLVHANLPDKQNKSVADGIRSEKTVRTESSDDKQNLAISEPSEDISSFGSMSDNAPLAGLETNISSVAKKKDESALGEDVTSTIAEKQNIIGKPNETVGIVQNFVLPELTEDESLLGLPSSYPSNAASSIQSQSMGNAPLKTNVEETKNKVIENDGITPFNNDKEKGAIDELRDEPFLFGLSDEKDDLFGGISTQNIPEKKEEASDKNKMFNRDVISSEQPLPFEAISIKTPIQQVPKPETGKVKPPSSLSIIKSELFEGGRDERDGEVQTAVSKKIGKLNIPSNLNINPSKLMPGAKFNKPSPPEVSSTVVSAEQVQKETVSSPIDLSLPPSSGGVLMNSAKDRIKIQVKRRPQTRKARHEALRTSGIDFGSDQQESPFEAASEKDSATSSSFIQTGDNSPSPGLASNPYSPSTDGEDYFNVPELGDHSEKDDHIFSGSLLPKEPLLFHGSPVISPSERTNSEYQPQLPQAHPEDIFSSSSAAPHIPRQPNDDDLFSSALGTSQSSPSHNPLFPKVKPKSTQSVKPVTKSLFDDDDDIDIFFGSNQPTMAENKKEVLKPERDAAESENFVDPLGLLKGS